MIQSELTLISQSKWKPYEKKQLLVVMSNWENDGSFITENGRATRKNTFFAAMACTLEKVMCILH